MATQLFLSKTGFRPVTVAAITSASVTDFAEAAQDSVGGILVDTASIDFTYTDGTPSISAALTLTGVAAGAYGSASSVATFTVDAQGRLTAAATTPISITASQISDFVSAAQDAVLDDFTMSFMLMGA